MAMSVLGPDELHAVFSLICARQLLSAARVGKSWHCASRSDSLWRALLRDREFLPDEDDEDARTLDATTGASMARFRHLHERYKA